MPAERTGRVLKRNECGIGNGLFLKAFWLVAAAFASAAFAAEDDVFAMCSTVGPDLYCDGTVVKDGECYALVYTRTGCSFAGFLADGSLVNTNDSEVLMMLPQAEDGHCKPTLCVVTRDYADAHKNGVWELYLLDTRNVDGSAAELDSGHNVVRVKRWGKTEASINFNASPFAVSALGAPPVLAANVTALPADVPLPSITAFDAQDAGRLGFKVANTVSYLTYKVVGAESLEALGEGTDEVGGEKKDGRTGGELELGVNRSKAHFFKVVAEH